MEPHWFCRVCNGPVEVDVDGPANCCAACGSLNISFIRPEPPKPAAPKPARLSQERASQLFADLRARL